jgi:hypothetical protein
MHIHAATEEVAIMHLLATLDKKGQILEKKPKFVKQGQVRHTNASLELFPAFFRPRIVSLLCISRAAVVLDPIQSRAKRLRRNVQGLSPGAPSAILKQNQKLVTLSSLAASCCVTRARPSPSVLSPLSTSPKRAVLPQATACQLEQALLAVAVTTKRAKRIVNKLNKTGHSIWLALLLLVNRRKRALLSAGRR